MLNIFKKQPSHLPYKQIKKKIIELLKTNYVFIFYCVKYTIYIPISFVSRMSTRSSPDTTV